MRRISIAFALAACWAISALGQGGPTVLHGVLTGSQLPGGGGDPDGLGLVTIVAPGGESPIGWTVSFQGIQIPATVELRARPANPALGGDVVIATLSTNSSMDAKLVTAPDTWYLTMEPNRIVAVVKNDAFPDGALYGRMSSQGMPGVYTLPVVGRVAGQGGTAFVTDLRLTSFEDDSASGDVSVEIEWWPGGSGAVAPAATFAKTIEPGTMLVLNDVILTELGLSQALGAMRVLTSRPVQVTARIYNDQVAVGKGTFGQFERGVTSDYGKVQLGGIPHLHNVPIVSGGSRTNIGWFNHTTTPVTLLVTAYRPDGTSLGLWAGYIHGGKQQQIPIADIIPATESIGDFYLLYEVDHAEPGSKWPIDFYLYASVTDNVNGDAIFVPAQPR